MSDLDDLLQPSVQKTAIEPREKPFRIQSQFWIAFLGGALPAAVVALINAHRLDLPRARRWAMVAMTVAALGVIFFLWLRQPHDSFTAFLRSGRDMRLYARVVGVVLYLGLAAMQRSADARYQVFSDGEHASLWGLGIATTLILGTLQTFGLAWLAWLAQ